MCIRDRHQPGVHHRQAGHADRGGGGEQRVHKGDVRPLLHRGEGDAQQAGAY